MRILLATDAWKPQVNGVVTTYEWLAREVPALGSQLVMLTPADYASMPCPTYPEIALALPRPRQTARLIAAAAPDAIHIATEGPVGWSVRRWCLANRVPFTTSFHTRFPEYIRARFAVPETYTYALLRRFHNAGSGMMVASPSLGADLKSRGFDRILPWTRGVDLSLFRPRAVRMFGDGPVLIYVGRVAIEKSIEDFLDLDVPGRKVVVGDGPQRAELMRRYPDVLFTGHKSGQELAEAYASADVFVFPSRTDTFGIVLIEAMASGVPVAAYPVTGPVDIVTPGVSGALDRDLKSAVLAALQLPRGPVEAAAARFTWGHAARMFVDNVGRVVRAAKLRSAPGRAVFPWPRSA
ncbi:MAG: glycosyltransferase family 4 protein [Hyphomicrobiaceae bacterium]